MNNKFLFSVIGIAAVLLIAFFARGLILQKDNQSNSGSMQVVASFYPMYFFASQIAGDKAQVYNITPAGSEPHDYEPSPQDTARIENSKMLVVNGANLEPWLDKVKQNIASKNIKVVVVSEGLAMQEVEEGGQKVIDPHVWLSPPLAKQKIIKILDGFIAIDLANKAYYEINAKLLGDKLDALDVSYRKGLANCLQKDIITSHTAFGYLAKAYGLNQVPIAGLSPDAEPSAKQIAEIAQFAKTHNVKYIFFESLVSPKLAETIAKEIGAQTLVLDPIEGISEDNIKQGENYFTQMEQNLANLKIALQCNKD